MAASDRRECEFSLIRYIPDPVKSEFVNIGVMLRDLGTPGRTVLRFTRDWARVRCLDPEADIETLEGLESELRQKMSEVPELLSLLQDSLSTTVQITVPKTCLAETFMTQLDQLMGMYVDRYKVPRELKQRGKGLVFSSMRSHFEHEGVWDAMVKRIAVAKYTSKGNPLHIDCGYRTNGTMKMFQAISLETDVDGAVKLAFAAPYLMKRVKELENAKLELTAFIEPVRDVGEDDERLDQYQFGYRTMIDYNIRVLTISDMARVAATAREDLRI